MGQYENLIKALRSASTVSTAWEKLMHDAAAAIEALNRLVDLNTERCEGLREQLRKAQESYERHLNELEAQLPKRGEWIHGKELSRAYIGNCCVGIDYEDFRCSACGCVVEVCEKPKWNYCPNCGAKMTEAQDETEIQG